MHVSSFDINKAITFKKFFAKIKLSPSARLVIRCLVDFWNPTKGLVYPGQKVIAECTGLTERSVTSAVEELRSCGLIYTTRRASGLNYYFSTKFFEALEFFEEKNSEYSGKKFGYKSEKISDPYKEQIKEQKNNNVIKLKNEFWERDHTVDHTVSVDSTRKLLEEKNNLKKGSPLDFNFEEAKNFLDNLLPELQNSFFAVELRKKWNLPSPGGG